MKTQDTETQDAETTQDSGAEGVGLRDVCERGIDDAEFERRQCAWLNRPVNVACALLVAAERKGSDVVCGKVLASGEVGE